jgi:acyl-CoA synthetase (NDP forming)
VTSTERDAASDARLSLDRLLEPRTIAIVGSVSRPDRMGARTVRHLQEAGFGGDVRAVSDVAELAGRGPIDVAVVAVPAAAVGDVLERLASSTAHAVVYSSGFGETGAEPLRRPQGPMRVLGPNTVGFMWARSRAVVTFAQAFDDHRIGERRSGVVLLSQSGAFGVRLVRAARRRGLELDGFVGTGNEDDYGVAAILDALAVDERLRPRVALLYLEGVGRDGELAASLAAAADAGITVVTLVGGRSSAAAAAARSHTAAVSPDHAVLSELVRWHGGLTVAGDRQLVDAAIALSAGRRAAGRRWAVLTGSGGAGVVAADLLADADIEIAPLTEATRARLAATLPSFANTANPVDVTASAIADTPLLAGLVDVLATSGEVDGALVVGRAEQAGPLQAASDAAGFSIVTAVLDGDATVEREAAERGELVLGDLTAAVNASAALATDPMPMADRIDRDAASAGLRRGALCVDDVATSMRLVSEAGVRVAPWATVATDAEALTFLHEASGPVVLKANVAAAVHKAGIGAVRLDLFDDDAVTAALGELLTFAPSALIARQLRGAPEFIVGVQRDDALGLVAAIGLGGGSVELTGRTVSIPALASAGWIAERVERTILRRDERHRHLAGPLAAVARRLTTLVVTTGAVLVECNPLVPTADGLVALDARVVGPAHKEQAIDGHRDG